MIEKEIDLSSLVTDFADDDDKVGFGHWLSGFTDGEGCFRIAYSEGPQRANPNRVRIHFETKFIILLRMDDRPILESIKNYFGCGVLSPRIPKTPGINPQVALEIRRPIELMHSVVPHFDRFPLRAKKRKDYEIWRQAVEIAYSVVSKPPKRRTGKGRLGFLPRWSDEERAEFKNLVGRIKTQRLFKI